MPISQRPSHVEQHQEMRYWETDLSALDKTRRGCVGELRRTITHDNGPEFSLHHRLHALGLQTFFCNPHSPWQKETVENMNGRIRRFILRRINPDSFSNDDLQALAVAVTLNHIPRKCLAFQTPAEVFFPMKPLHFKCEFTFPLLLE